MKYRSLILGVLLAAAPLGAQPAHEHADRPALKDPRLSLNFLLQFSLTESPQEAAKRMGPPQHVSDANAGYITWQFRLGAGDLHDPSHTLVFRRSDGRLISVTRTLHDEENVDALFPEEETSSYYWPDAQKPRFSVRLRRLNQDALLLAMGSPKRGVPTNQLLLIHRSALRAFLPWLDDQLR